MYEDLWFNKKCMFLVCVRAAFLKKAHTELNLDYQLYFGWGPCTSTFWRKEGGHKCHPLTLDIYILLIPTVYIHKSDWFFRNHFCFLSNTEWKKSVWQTTPKNEILKILAYSIFLIYMCPRLAVTACDHTGTPPHRPTFASKNDGRTPDFILGEWRQMIIN